MNATPLKPCPFCGQEAALEGAGASGHIQTWWVSCNTDGCAAFGNVFDTDDAAIHSWNRRIAQPEASSAWIPVGERMPEQDVYVLVHNGKWTGMGKHVDEDERFRASERWQDEHTEFIEHLGPKVTHWMPLPLPPSPPLAREPE